MAHNYNLTTDIQTQTQVSMHTFFLYTSFNSKQVHIHIKRINVKHNEFYLIHYCFLIKLKHRSIIP